MQITNVGRQKQSMLIVESLENTKKQKEKENLTFPHPHLKTVSFLLPVVLPSGNIIEHTEVHDRFTDGR